MEIPSARWTGRGWEANEITEWHFLPDGKVTNQKVAAAPPISETPEDLKLLARDADEFTFFDLQKQIFDMKSKGIDAAPYEVDLQVKLAFPLISPLMILIAIPFALRKQMSGSMAMSFGVAMLIGFGYWVLSAFCISLGHNSALPPWAAPAYYDFRPSASVQPRHAGVISRPASPARSVPPNCRSRATARRPVPGGRRGCARGDSAAAAPRWSPHGR